MERIFSNNMTDIKIYAVHEKFSKKGGDTKLITEAEEAKIAKDLQKKLSSKQEIKIIKELKTEILTYLRPFLFQDIKIFKTNSPIIFKFNKKIIGLINKYSNTYVGQKAIDKAFNTLDETIRNKIEEIDCSNSSLTYFPNLIGFKKLKKISCNNTSLKKLNVIKIRNLEFLYCSNNKNLKEFKFFASNLKKLHFYNNKLLKDPIYSAWEFPSRNIGFKELILDKRFTLIDTGLLTSQLLQDIANNHYCPYLKIIPYFTEQEKEQERIKNREEEERLSKMCCCIS